jgi:hypothetical protein
MDSQESKDNNPSENQEHEAPEVEYSDDVYASASKSMTDYSHFMPNLKPKRKWPRVVGWTLLGLVVAAGLAGGGYWVAKHVSPAKPAKSSSSTSQQSTTATTQTKGQSSTTQPKQNTTQYDSTNFGLSFSYPNGWTVADKGNGKLTATSPALQLTDADGQAQSGQVVMLIQNKAGADLSMFSKGNAVAVLQSQKITYTKPTGTQRAQTYLSFLQYATTTTHGALDGVYVTGNYGYKYAQQIPESDVDKIDPLIRVIFVQCADTKCTKTSPLSVSSDMWKNSSFSDPIESMLKSLAIQ